MSKQKKVSINITGDVSGQVVIGDNNEVIKRINHLPVNSDKFEELHRLLGELKSRIQMDPQEDKRADALKKVNELEHAIFENKPELTTIEYIKVWFAGNLPDLTDEVAGIISEFTKHTL